MQCRRAFSVAVPQFGSDRFAGSHFCIDAFPNAPTYEDGGGVDAQQSAGTSEKNPAVPIRDCWPSIMAHPLPESFRAHLAHRRGPLQVVDIESRPKRKK